LATLHFELAGVQSMLTIQALMAKDSSTPSITIRKLDAALKARLRVQAAAHGRSMEEEARDILRTALSRKRDRAVNLAAAIRARFAPLGGVELAETERKAIRPPPDFAS
jgi:plasmid stability protein